MQLNQQIIKRFLITVSVLAFACLAQSQSTLNLSSMPSANMAASDLVMYGKFNGTKYIWSTTPPGNLFQQSTNYEPTKTILNQTGNGGAADAQIYGREYLGAWFSNLVANANVAVDFVGDSTTAGGGFALTGYQLDQLFSRSVGYPKLTVFNSGMSGVSTVQWAANYSSSLTTTISRNPTLIFVRYGINDYPDIVGFSNALNSGLSTLRASLPVSKTSIVLETPNSINDQGTPTRNMLWNLQMDNVVRAAARKYSCAFLDVFTYMRDTTNSAMVWKTDQVHPIEYGNLMINDLHVRAVYPPSIAIVVERRNDGTYSSPDISTTPTNYAKGFTISRISPTQNWFVNGMAMTERDASADIGFQRISGYSSQDIVFRTGWRDTWNAWQFPIMSSTNFNAASAVFAPNVTDIPSTYPFGLNLHRCSPGKGFFYDGTLFTLHMNDGTYYQQMTPYNGQGFAFRNGANASWQNWQFVPTSDTNNFDGKLGGVGSVINGVAHTNGAVTASSYSAVNGGVISKVLSINGGSGQTTIGGSAGHDVASFNDQGGGPLGISANGYVRSASGIFTNGMSMATNYVAANFTPIPGQVIFASSNNWLYAVTVTKTNPFVQIAP